MTTEVGAPAAARTGAPGPRVLVAHDYLTQRGGAERVALSLLRAFPGAPMLTSIYNPETTYPEFAEHEVRTLWVDRLAAFREDPRRALLFLAHAVSTADVQGFDALVCSSSGWAHGIPSPVPKVVYCHTPARWLWETDDYLAGVGTVARPLLRAAFPLLRRWDRRVAATCTTYLANSSTVRDRIQRAYGIEAQLVYPPVSIDVDAPEEPVLGVEPGFLLTVSRARAYKNTGLVCEAVEAEPDLRLVVVGEAPPREGGGVWSHRLQAVSRMSDGQMRWLYRNARALIGVSHEDFGLTPVEAYAFGTPAVLLRAGGYLDSSLEGVTCVFVDELSVAGLRAALEQLRRSDFDPDRIRAHAYGFREERFQQAVRDAVDTAVADCDRVPGAGTDADLAIVRQRTPERVSHPLIDLTDGPVLSPDATVDLTALEQRRPDALEADGDPLV